MKGSRFQFALLFITFLSANVCGQTDSILPIFCFPEEQMPVIDGKTDDWRCVPQRYAISTDQMHEDEGKHTLPNLSTLDISVKVGWSKKENRLYVLYEAYDNYWSFSRNDLLVDIFEIVVDGDRSGGPLIDKFYPYKDTSKEEAWEIFHGRHAQNYHIYTPSKAGDWCMYWGPQQWLKNSPYSAHAYRYNFEEGEKGKLTLEFYITPYDYASPKGAEYSIPSELYENKLIGLCWAVIDYDNSNGSDKDGFWNLSKYHTMYGNASQLRTFRLMPFEK